LFVSLSAFDLVSGSHLTSNLPDLMHCRMVDRLTWHLRFLLMRVRILVAGLVARASLRTLVRSALLSIGFLPRPAATQ
jgi:hypothetical protein